MNGRLPNFLRKGPSALFQTANPTRFLEVQLTYPMLYVRPLVEFELLERQWVATFLLLVWVKLMDPLQSVFQDFFLLVKMITLMIG